MAAHASPPRSTPRSATRPRSPGGTSPSSTVSRPRAASAPSRSRGFPGRRWTSRAISPSRPSAWAPSNGPGGTQRPDGRRAGAPRDDGGGDRARGDRASRAARAQRPRPRTRDPGDGRHRHGFGRRHGLRPRPRGGARHRHPARPAGRSAHGGGRGPRGRGPDGARRRRKGDDGVSIRDRIAAADEAYGALRALGRDPSALEFGAVSSPTEALLEGRPVTLFGTNNYLGLTFDPACLEAAAAGARGFGAGTTGSRIANGSYAGHGALEREIAPCPA